MSDVQDYQSSLSDAAVSRKYETFSYLPTLTKESTRAQIQYIVDKGWNPGIEHTERIGKTTTSELLINSGIFVMYLLIKRILSCNGDAQTILLISLLFRSGNNIISRRK